MDTPEEVADPYETGYRDGENNNAADWAATLEDCLPDDVDRWSPSAVAAYIERLRARPHVEYDIQDDLGQPYWIDRQTGERIDPTGGFMNALRDSSSTD